MNHLENGYVDVDDVLFTRLSVIVDRLFDVGRRRRSFKRHLIRGGGLAAVAASFEPLRVRQ